MIVSCPNCGLEQPLDPFCAGCGKQLPKLIAEHKSKMQIRNSRTKKFILISVAFFSFGFYVYYAYQNPEARPFASSRPTTAVKVNLATGKIKASKYKTKEFAKSLKVKNFTLTEGSKVEPLTAATKKKVKTITPAAKGSIIKIQEVYILNIDACTDGAVEPGPISQDELTFFLDCAEVVSKLRPGDKSDLDPDLPFGNSASLEQTKNRLHIKFELIVDDSPFTSDTKLQLSKNDTGSAGYISKINMGKAATSFLEDSLSESSPDLLKSAALSRVFGLQADDKPSPKGYFLAVYE